MSPIVTPGSKNRQTQGWNSEEIEVSTGKLRKLCKNTLKTTISLKMDTKHLMKSLDSAANAHDFVSAVYRSASLTTRNSVRWKNGLPVAMVFFGSEFGEKFLEMLLQHPKAREYLSCVEEFRLVATRISKDKAQLLRALNANAIVFWVSSKEWIGRDSYASDPVSLDVDVGAKMSDDLKILGANERESTDGLGRGNCGGG